MKAFLNIFMLPAITALAFFSSTAEAGGASARARVTAEVVGASSIDFTKAVATAGTAGTNNAPQPGQTAPQQPQPQVKVVVVDGVTFVSIDYN